MIAVTLLDQKAPVRLPPGLRVRGPERVVKGEGRSFPMQLRSRPCVAPVLNNSARIELVPALSGVWPPPGTTRWMALGMKVFTSSPHFGFRLCAIKTWCQVGETAFFLQLGSCFLIC